MTRLAAAAMGPYVAQYVTALSVKTGKDQGAALATGNYLRVGDQTCLLTNAHVIDDAEGDPIGHLPGPTDDYVLLPPVSVLPPVDGVLARIPHAIGKLAITVAQIDERFAPAQYELLSFCGCPGTSALRHESTEHRRRQTWFGSALETPIYPFMTQAFARDDEANPAAATDVALEYPAQAPRVGDGVEAGLPNAKGLSGSLVWDTKFVAAAQAGRAWSPSDARVCALVWGVHAKPDVVLATRIEHVRNALLALLRREAAYFRWIDRGRPLHDDLDDWWRAIEMWPALR